MSSKDDDKLAIGSPGKSPDGADVPDYAVQPVPKVPRRFKARWAFSDIIRILFLGGFLAMIIVARKPCSNAVANFVDSFEEPEQENQQGVRRTESGDLVGPNGEKLERLTPEQIKKRFGKDGDKTETSPKPADKPAPNQANDSRGSGTTPTPTGP